MDDPGIKNCAICGQPAKSRNFEHVVPKWLLKWTEHPTSLDPRDAGSAYSLWNCKLGSCQSCNSRFGSTLEDRVKSIFERIRGLQPVGQRELNDLLDWFDFMRTKLWLFGLQKHRDEIKITPHFRAAQRVRTTDRVLFVGVSQLFHRAIVVEPERDLLFYGLPCFMRLSANGLSFVSFSAVGIAARILGLPHIRERRVRPDGKTEVELVTRKEDCQPQAFIQKNPGFSYVLQAVYPEEMSPSRVLTKPGVIFPNLSRPETSVHAKTPDGRCWVPQQESPITFPLVQPFDVTMDGPSRSLLAAGRKSLGLQTVEVGDPKIANWWATLRALAQTGQTGFEGSASVMPAFRTRQGIVQSMPGMTVLDASEFRQRQILSAAWVDNRLEFSAATDAAP